MMPLSFRVQFVGRFAYLIDSANREVRIVAPKMDGGKFNFPTHHATLAIPDRLVVPESSATPTSVFTVPVSDGDTSKATTWLAWDIAGYDIDFANYMVGPITSSLRPIAGQGQDHDSRVPSLDELVTGATPTVHPDILRRNVPNTCPVTTRITILGGALNDVEVQEFDMPAVDAERWFMEAFNATSLGVPTAGQTAFVTTDAIEWTASLTDHRDTLLINLRKFGGGVEKQIACRATAEDLAFGFSHVCGSAGKITRDDEFASYYDLLANEPDVATRKIPVLKQPGNGAFVCSVSPRCRAAVQGKI
jgi:hypothetical protein